MENFHAGYGPIEVLKGISLEVQPGEIVALIGANGAGKTSTLMGISGCLRARRGRVLFEGREIQQLPPHEIVRRGICQSPEGRKIFRGLTVLENLQMGAFTRRDKPAIEHDLAARLRVVSDSGRAPQPGRRHALRRRAADAGRGPRADGPAQAAVARRALAGPGADDRGQDLRRRARAQPAKAWRSCWSSRPRGWRSSWPIAAT